MIMPRVLKLLTEMECYKLKDYLLFPGEMELVN